jgi:hypothetical protein
MGPGPLSMLHFLALMLRSLVVAIIAEKQKIIFRLDSGAHFPVSPFSPRHQSNDKVIIWGISGQPQGQPLVCSLGDLLFCYSFLIVPETPVTLLGWNLLSQLKAQIFLPQGSYFCCTLLQEQRDSTVWTDEMIVGRAWMALPIQIKFKNPSQFPQTIPKNNIPSSLRDMRPYAYHKFLKTTRATN